MFERQKKSEGKSNRQLSGWWERYGVLTKEASFYLTGVNSNIIGLSNSVSV